MLSATTTGNPSEDTLATVRTSLRQALVRWLRRHGCCDSNAKDLADEVFARACRRFFSDPSSISESMPWQLVWSWSRRVAQSLLIEHLRRAKRASIDTAVDVQVLAGVPVVSTDGIRPGLAAALTEALIPRLAPADRETLLCLMAGVYDNAEIAAP